MQRNTVPTQLQTGANWRGRISDIAGDPSSENSGGERRLAIVEISESVPHGDRTYLGNDGTRRRTCLAL